MPVELPNGLDSGFRAGRERPLAPTSGDDPMHQRAVDGTSAVWPSGGVASLSCEGASDDPALHVQAHSDSTAGRRRCILSVDRCCRRSTTERVRAHIVSVSILGARQDPLLRSSSVQTCHGGDLCASGSSQGPSRQCSGAFDGEALVSEEGAAGVAAGSAHAVAERGIVATAPASRTAAPGPDPEPKPYPNLVGRPCTSEEWRTTCVSGDSDKYHGRMAKHTTVCVIPGPRVDSGVDCAERCSERIQGTDLVFLLRAGSVGIE